MDQPVTSADETKGDPLREPPIRYLGYANEVGESFRSQIHVNYVRATYGLATAYVIADAIHKGDKLQKNHGHQKTLDKQKFSGKCLTLWHGKDWHLSSYQASQ